MRKFLFILVALGFAVLFGGCSANRGKMLKTQQIPSPQNAQTVQSSAATYPNVGYGSVTVGPIKTRTQLEEAIKLLKIKREIHFKFNSYQIEPIHEYGINEDPRKILDKIADFMLKHPNVYLRIEGNCDERGTEEYNLALGLKRALAAKNYLVAKGVPPDRISVISYGESQPVDPGHNEYAWAKNRRDHFVFILKGK